jgi:putative FmdB family regulatory protein
MPTYDYVCEACGHEFELFQSINDPVKRKCPKCARQKLRRKIGAGAAIVFKGSGFYQTDYRSEKYKQRAAADKPPSESSGDKSSGEKSGGEKSGGEKSAGSAGEKSSKPTASEGKSQSKTSSDSKGGASSRKHR